MAILRRIYFLRINPLLVALSFCSWGLYRRVYWRMNHELWLDERAQIINMHLPLWDFLKVIQKGEFCAFLSGDYYLTYPFFKLFGPNKWGLAIPHIISTLIGFYLIYILCKRYLKSIWGYAIVFALVCFHDVLRFHAFEIRTYAVLPTLALASFYFTDRLVMEPEKITTKQKWGMRVFFIVTMLWHLYGILIVGLPLLYFLGTILREKKFVNVLKGAIRFFLPLVLICAPLWLFSVFGEHLSMPPFYTFEYFPDPLVNPVGFLKSVVGNLVGDRRLYFLLLGPALAFFLPQENRYKQMGFLLILVILPIALLIVADLRSSYWFVQRQFVWAIPYFILFVAWCWESSLEYLLCGNKPRQ